jgi:hypothetical protein
VQQERKGVIAYKTNTLYIIAFFEQNAKGTQEPIMAGPCAANAGKVFDELISLLP